MIVENLEQWQTNYDAWLARYQQSGELIYTDYPYVRNQTAPAGSGIDLAQSRLMLISTAGGFLRGAQEPFDAANDLGDYSIRLFPADTPFAAIAFAHEHYDHTAVTADPEVLLPLNHLADMTAEGKIGALAPSVISFCGYMPDMARIINEVIPPIMAIAQAEQVEGALLVPA